MLFRSHQITFRPTRTVHEREEETAPHTFLPAPAEVVKATCPAITTAYVERREETTEAAGWEEMEALAPNPRVSEKKTPETAAETPVAEVNLGSPGFSKAEIAWACSLLKAGWQQPHAVQEAPAHMRDQALALGLKAQRGANTIGNKRATALFRYVRYKMSPTARIPSLQYAAECLRQWQAHQGTASPRQPVTVGASSENSDQEGHQTEGKTTEESSAEPTSLHWRLPLLDEVLTSKAVQQQAGDEFEEVFKEAMAERVATTLASFRVEAEVRPEDISIGPTVVRLGIRPTGKPLLKEDEKGHPVPVRDAAGNNVYEVRTRVSRIMALQNDLALVLEARTIRMEAPVPGRPYVGVEIPNVNARLVTLREILESKEYKAAKEESKLTVALGRDVAGAIRIGDLAKMPHLLIAGATGSGKSVAINTIISSLITQATPQDVRILMVDPKMVELTLYNGIPHLLAPVVTEAAKVVSLLKIAIAEMEQRYRLFSQLGVRNLNGYRRLRAEKIAHGDTTLNNLPAIVIIIDELADLMMVASEEVEGLICRLAQLARATGIHLVVATQRPSVDVITGLIKANIPTRLAFMVSSSVDSRTIIDMGGAERLLGRGDMLYLPADAGKPERIQGAFVADDDAECLAKYWRKQFEDLKATGRFAPPTVTTEASDGAIEQQHFEWNIPETPETEIEPAPSFPTTGQHVNSQVMRHIQRYLQGSRYLNGRLVSMEEGRVPEGVMLPCAFTLLTPSNQLLAAEAAVWFTQRNSATGIRTQLGIGAERAGKLRDELAAKGFADRDAPPSASQASPALKPLLVTCGFLEEEACDTALEVHEEEAEIQQHTPA